MANTAKPTSLVRQIKQVFWLRDIENADSYTGSYRYVRRQKPKAKRELLGVERTGKFKGVIQGRAQGYHQLTGHILLRDNAPELAPRKQKVVILEVYRRGEADVLAKGQTENDLCSERMVSALEGVIHRATVATEIRRIKRLR